MVQIGKWSFTNSEDWQHHFLRIFNFVVSIKAWRTTCYVIDTDSTYICKMHRIETILWKRFNLRHFFYIICSLIHALKRCFQMCIGNKASVVSLSHGAANGLSCKGKEMVVGMTVSSKYHHTADSSGTPSQQSSGSQTQHAEREIPTSTQEIEYLSQGLDKWDTMPTTFPAPAYPRWRSMIRAWA